MKLFIFITIGMSCFLNSACQAQSNVKTRKVALVAVGSPFFTQDSALFFRRDDSTLANGYYRIFGTEIMANTSGDDGVFVLEGPTPYNSTGIFAHGRKEGLWLYHKDDKLLKRENYKAGKLISREICPCRR